MTAADDDTLAADVVVVVGRARGRRTDRDPPPARPRRIPPRHRRAAPPDVPPPLPRGRLPPATARGGDLRFRARPAGKVRQDELGAEEGSVGEAGGNMREEDGAPRAHARAELHGIGAVSRARGRVASLLEEEDGAGRERRGRRDRVEVEGARRGGVGAGGDEEQSRRVLSLRRAGGTNGGRRGRRRSRRRRARFRFRGDAIGRPDAHVHREAPARAVPMGLLPATPDASDDESRSGRREGRFRRRRPAIVRIASRGPRRDIRIDAPRRGVH
mmetsp:Transcript_25153/g.53553  ORF Transcript_25153/g.53553 Transcript_25153/m.53553 type:complete len:272 (-) Transcript_25153:15-830(-)